MYNFSIWNKKLSTAVETKCHYEDDSISSLFHATLEDALDHLDEVIKQKKFGITIPTKFEIVTHK